jgi:hypothetical protein
VLGFPISPVKLGATASPVNRRGDTHSSLALTPTAAARRAAQTPRALLNANASLASNDQPLSAAPMLSAQMVPSSEPDEIRAIWRTTVNLSDRPSHPEEEIKAIMGGVYKTRPFGVKVGGMRVSLQAVSVLFYLSCLPDLLTSSFHALVQIMIR